MTKIEFKVKNSGLYGEGFEGTWSDLLEEIGLQVPGWHTYEVDRTEWHGGCRHYFGGLYGESGNELYRFWAVVGEDSAEIEIEAVENE